MPPTYLNCSCVTQGSKTLNQHRPNMCQAHTLCVLGQNTHTDPLPNSEVYQVPAPTRSQNPVLNSDLTLKVIEQNAFQVIWGGWSIVPTGTMTDRNKLPGGAETYGQDEVQAWVFWVNLDLFGSTTMREGRICQVRIFGFVRARTSNCTNCAESQKSTNI